MFKYSRILLFFFLIYTLTGCQILQAPEKNKIILPQQMASLQPQKNSFFVITGQILDWRAKPLSNAVVNIETSQSHTLSTTDEEGIYSIQITQSESDTIKISVNSNIGNATYEYAHFHNSDAPLQLDLMLCADNTLDVL